MGWSLFFGRVFWLKHGLANPEESKAFNEIGGLRDCSKYGGIEVL